MPPAKYFAVSNDEGKRIQGDIHVLPVSGMILMPDASATSRSAVFGQRNYGV
jgi:hypothetical protein